MFQEIFLTAASVAERLGYLTLDGESGVPDPEVTLLFDGLFSMCRL